MQEHFQKILVKLYNMKYYILADFVIDLEWML